MSFENINATGAADNTRPEGTGKNRPERHDYMNDVQKCVTMAPLQPVSG